MVHLDGLISEKQNWITVYFQQLSNQTFILNLTQSPQRLKQILLDHL